MLAAADWAGTDLTALGVTTNTAGAYDLASAAGASGDNGMSELHRALTNAAFSGGLCDAVLGGTLRAAYTYDGTNTRGPGGRRTAGLAEDAGLARPGGCHPGPCSPPGANAGPDQ